MSMKNKFEYALKPILVMKKWALDSLMNDLSKVNQEIGEKVKHLRTLHLRIVSAHQDWSAHTTTSGHLTAENFMRYQNFISDLVKQELEVTAKKNKYEQIRDDITKKVAHVQKEIEKFEEHSDSMESKFIAVLNSTDHKNADDQWNNLRIRRNEHGC
jgi:flagellar biosynthesis chaperone FliJ